MKSPLFLNFQNSTTAILKVMIASLSWSDLKLDILVKKIRFQRKGWFQERNETQSLKYWKYFFGTRNIDIKPAWLQILFRNTFEDLRICCSEYKGSRPIHFKSPMLVEPLFGNQIKLKLSICKQTRNEMGSNTLCCNKSNIMFLFDVN